MDATSSAHSPKNSEEINTKAQTNKNNFSNSEIQKIKCIENISKEKNDVIITLDISICNKPVKLLVDSGAHATMLRSNIIKSNILYYPQIKYAMVGINRV